MIGLENSHHPLNQSDAKLKPIATETNLFTSNSHWLLVIFSFVLIGRCAFGITTLNRKCSLFSLRLTPRSDQYINSPYNFNTLSSRQVMGYCLEIMPNSQDYPTKKCMVISWEN